MFINMVGIHGCSIKSLVLILLHINTAPECLGFPVSLLGIFDAGSYLYNTKTHHDSTMACRSPRPLCTLVSCVLDVCLNSCYNVVSCFIAYNCNSNVNSSLCQGPPLCYNNGSICIVPIVLNAMMYFYPPPYLVLYTTTTSSNIRTTSSLLLMKYNNNNNNNNNNKRTE